MERVVLMMKNGDRIGGWLNPESLVMRRLAGVKPQSSMGGSLTGMGLADDAVLYTGGGMTELRLDLLVDVSVAGSTVQTADVRQLTQPLWDLTENTTDATGHRSLPRVQLFYGKWNFSGIITAMAERLEHFTTDGLPRRAWVRMRMLRVLSPPVSETAIAPTNTMTRHLPALLNTSPGSPSPTVPETTTALYEVEGGITRPDLLAQQFYNAPGLWRLIMAYNNIDNPFQIDEGQILQIPTLEDLEAIDESRSSAP